jgi:3-hydroxyacyl-CoA dehydrogenase
MEIRNVTLIGGGVLGSQIGFQTAYKGYNVTFYMRSEGTVGRTRAKIDRLYGIYKQALSEGKNGGHVGRGLTDDPKTADFDKLLQDLDRAYNGIVYERDLGKALADADLVIEALAEDVNQKIEFYEKAAPLFAEKAIVATNSSTLLPSVLAPHTGRPAKFMALHFANNIWEYNTAEVMGHAGTDPEVYKTVSAFAKSIGMIPLELHKEQPGYILNTMLVPFLHAAEYLWANEIADPATIDLTWKMATGAPSGPFQILDVVGVTTAYNIMAALPSAKDPNSTEYKIASKLKAMLDAGKLGVIAGEGFYKYNK